MMPANGVCYRICQVCTPALAAMALVAIQSPFGLE
jgi:hypothetical protein